MEIHGKLNLVDSQVKSDEFASDIVFNKLVVNNLSEVDQETLDKDVIIFNKADDMFYTYHQGTDGWVSAGSELNRIYDLDYTDTLFIDDEQDIYNIIHLDTENTQLSVDPDLFNFGEIGSPIDFVIDFWLRPKTDYCAGTLLYNGNSTGRVDIERSQNLVISTTHVDLFGDPEFQEDPTYRCDQSRIGKLSIRRPNLQSTSNIWSFHLVHVALIRSGDTTYLAINGKIEDSGPSVEYFHYDDVLIGNGYWGNVNYGIVNLRVSKNTDRGWTSDFTPPNFNYDIDANTDFLMDSTSNVVVDSVGNYTINVTGDAPTVTQDRFYYEIPRGFNGNTISTNLEQDKLVLMLPTDNIDNIYRFKTNITPFEIISLNDHHRYDIVQQTTQTLSANSEHDYFQKQKRIIVEPNLGTQFRDVHQLRDIYGFLNAHVNITGDTRTLYPDGSYITPAQFTNHAGHDYRNSKLNNVQDFYSNSNAYSKINYVDIFGIGTGLFIWDAVIKPNGNYWHTTHGYYSTTHGWSFVGYSSSNHVVMRYAANHSIRFRNYNAGHIYDYFHFIFAFYRGKIYAVSMNLNKETEYTVVQETTSATYTNFSSYIYQSSTPMFSFVRYRHINREVSDDDIQGLIQMAYIK